MAPPRQQQQQQQQQQQHSFHVSSLVLLAVLIFLPLSSSASSSLCDAAAAAATAASVSWRRLSQQRTRRATTPLFCGVQKQGRRHTTATGARDVLLQGLRGGGGGDGIQEPESLEELDQILADSTEKLVVIDFYSNNCPPCDAVAPLYQVLSESEEFQGDDNNDNGNDGDATEVANKVVFVKINAQEQPDIAARYQVTGWPTFIFIKRGQVVTEIVGGKLAEATLYDWVKLLMPK